MQRVLAQAEKEWKQFLRDKLSLGLAVAMPVVFVLLFGYTLAMDPDAVRLVVIDRDGSPLSRSLSELFWASGKFKAVDSEGLDETELLVAAKAEMVLVIPSGFSRRWRSGAGASAQALLDGVDANTCLVAQQWVEAFNAAFMRRHGGIAGFVTPPVRTQVRYWYNPGLSDKRYFGTGALGIVLIFFPALLGGIATSREHELGTVIQVYASTLSAAEWTLGKALPYIGIGVIELALAYAAGAWAFEYTLPPDPTPFLAASLFYISIGVVFGMYIGNATRSQATTLQAVQLGVLLLSMLLSGFLAPLENIVWAVRSLSYLIPAKYYIEVVRDSMLRGGGWEVVWLEVAVLAALALGAFVANLAVMRRMQFAD